MKRALVPVLVLATAAVPAAAASAGPAPSGYNVVAEWGSPSGTVICLMLQSNGGRNGVSCTTNRYDASVTNPRTTWTFLGARGRTRLLRAAPYQGEPEFTQPYGRTWWLYGGTPKLQGNSSILRCSSTRAGGMTCQNGARHGFRLKMAGGREVRSRF